MLDKIKQYAIFTFLIIVPCFYGQSLDLRQTQEKFFQSFSICLIGLFVGNIWLSLFLIWNVILYYYQGCVGSNQVMNIFIGTIIFMISRWYFKSKTFYSIRKPIMIVVFINLLFIILQFFRLDPLHTQMSAAGKLLEGPYNGMDGIFCIRMASGIYNLIAMPIIALANPLLSLVCLVPIFFSSSSTVAMAFVLLFLFFTYFTNKRIFRIALIIIPILGFLYILHDFRDDKKTSLSRFPLWHMTVKYALSNPIGYGPDSYRNYTKQKNFLFKSDGNYNVGTFTKIEDGKAVFKYYSPTNDNAEIKRLTDTTLEHGLVNGELPFWDNPHNEYLQVFFQYGIVGLVLLIGFLRELFNRFMVSLKDREMVAITTCLLAYLIISLCHFPLELARLAYLFPIILGAFYAKTDKEIE